MRAGVRASVMMSVAAMAVSTAAAPVGQPQALGMTLEGLRSTKGQILVCVTRTAAYFPDCTDDPDGRHFTVAAKSGPIPLGALTPGDYAIAIVHDENGNGKLDTFAGIPREGVGFSRNPVLRFGAPGFKSASFTIAAEPVEQAIRLKYFL